MQLAAGPPGDLAAAPFGPSNARRGGVWLEEQRIASLARWAGSGPGAKPPRRSTRLEVPQVPKSELDCALEGLGGRRRGGEQGALAMSMRGPCPTTQLAAEPRRDLAAAPFGPSNARRGCGWLEEQRIASLARWVGSGPGATPPHRSTTLEAPQVPRRELDRALEGLGGRRRGDELRALARSMARTMPDDAARSWAAWRPGSRAVRAVKRSSRRCVAGGAADRVARALGGQRARCHASPPVHET